MNTSTWNSIIFDFDNTLVASNIDFYTLKQELILLLHENELAFDIQEGEAPPLSHLTAIPLEEGNKILNRKMWKIIEIYEIEGMKQAVLEPNVSKVLSNLSKTYDLSILTNNTADLTKSTLLRFDILKFFSFVVSRDNKLPLKPSPAGLKYMIDKMNYIPSKTLFIGDSPIDAIAAKNAQISFLAYKPKKAYFSERKVELAHSIDCFDELETWLIVNSSSKLT